MSKFAEGPFSAEIKSIEFTANNRPNASPDDFNIAIGLKDDAGNTDTAYLEVSQSYGQGAMAGKTQLQISLDTLSGLGWPAKFGVANALDFTQLDKLVGTRVDGNAKDTVKRAADGSEKTYHNVYIGRATLAKADIAARMKALMGGGAAQPVAAATAAAPTDEVF